MPVGREIQNSWHNLVNGFSCRLAATTNCTRCSFTFIVFQAMSAPALASLARECKGCPGTFCKGCHETEQFFCKGGDFRLRTPSAFASFADTSVVRTLRTPRRVRQPHLFRSRHLRSGGQLRRPPTPQRVPQLSIHTPARILPAAIPTWYRRQPRFRRER